MDLHFDTSWSVHTSASQNARVLTEDWVGRSAFCPGCGEKIERFPNNRPVADFFCRGCGEEYELKSSKSTFGAKAVDGAYETMRARLAAENSPNLMLLHYDLGQLHVRDFFVVPKQFFIPEIIECRKPLKKTARRAGWIGCNILLTHIPAAGKVYFVRDGLVLAKKRVLAEWQRTLFLRSAASDTRGWLIEVMRRLDRFGTRTFELGEVYEFETELSRLFPQNKHVKPKIRQQLQFLRDRGYLEFTSRGRYRLCTGRQRLST